MRFGRITSPNQVQYGAGLFLAIAAIMIVLAGLTRARLQLRQPPKAERAVPQQVVALPDRPDEQYSVAAAYYYEHRFGEARATLEKLLRRFPDLEDAQRMMGMSLYSLGQFAAARRVLLKELKLNPNDAEATYFVGHTYLGEGDCSHAEPYYRRVLRLYPASFQAYYYLGVCYEAEGGFERATAAYEKSWSLSGKRFYAPALHLSRILLLQGRTQEAIARAEEATAIRPGSAAGQYALGNALYRANDIGRALSHLRRAVDLNKGMAEAHYLLGMAYRKQGRGEEAKRELMVFELLTQRRSPSGWLKTATIPSAAATSPAPTTWKP